MIQFAHEHNDAFIQLGAMRPGTHWSCFDVRSEEARSGGATRRPKRMERSPSIRQLNGIAIRATCGIPRFDCTGRGKTPRSGDRIGNDSLPHETWESRSSRY